MTEYTQNMTHSDARDSAADDTLDYRQPPSNLEVEQALLGAMLVNNEAAEQVREYLHPEHFFEPVHGRIYEMILRLIDRDHTADPIKLRPFFDKDEALADMGGGAYLARLAASAATIINAVDYGRTLRDLALRRSLISVGNEMVISAYDADPADSGEGQLEAAESKLFDLAQTGSAGTSFTPFRTAVYKALEAAEAAYKDPDKISGVSTGLKALDAQIGGLHPTDLLILAGRRPWGKPRWQPISPSMPPSAGLMTGTRGGYETHTRRGGGLFLVGNVGGSACSPCGGGPRQYQIRRNAPGPLDRFPI
ncbi:hypothetical protein JCM17845_17830 [Iodidimonas gelatinilytica]|uniref:DNA helicase DnaB-like N-terminal domain-containing protein n=1 Tax=Iodidimonas gelatinilytica TaxID=1236966 RepID=A0A5A7N1E7_9PROT|nr:hypothetical protein JCM17845_17830 [Iodidimonas gelatinilytica]